MKSPGPSKVNVAAEEKDETVRRQNLTTQSLWGMENNLGFPQMQKNMSQGFRARSGMHDLYLPFGADYTHTE